MLSVVPGGTCCACGAERGGPCRVCGQQPMALAVGSGSTFCMMETPKRRRGSERAPPCSGAPWLISPARRQQPRSAPKAPLVSPEVRVQAGPPPSSHAPPWLSSLL